MRPALVASLLLIGLIALGVRTPAVTAPFKTTKTNRQAILPGHAAWLVEGRWQKDVRDAEQDAIFEAQSSVGYYLENLTPPIRDWVPPVEYVQKLVKKKDVETKLFDEPVGEMRQVKLQLEITPERCAEMARNDREHRSHERMFWLGKLLAGLVAVLAAVNGYIHLDERTKGYYTGWLRLAAGGVAAAVGASLWWLS